MARRRRTRSRADRRGAAERPPLARDPVAQEMARPARALLATALAARGRGLASADVVHRARVACRRLDGLLRLLRWSPGGAAVRAHRRTLSRYRRLLGPVRDLDVLRAHVTRLGAGADAAALERLDGALLRRRRAAAAIADRRLRGTRTVRALGALARFLAPGGGLPPEVRLPRKRVARLLRRAAEAVIRRLAALRRRPGPAARHRLRIALKRLRYRTELLPRAAGRWAGPVFGRRRLRRLQDLLGEAQDMRVLLDALGEDPPLGTARARPLRAHLARAARAKAAAAAERAMALLGDLAAGPDGGRAFRAPRR